MKMKILTLPLCLLLAACTTETSSGPVVAQEADIPSVGTATTDAGTADTALPDLPSGDADVPGADQIPAPDTGPETSGLDPDAFYIFEAGPFVVPAGTERFLCYSFRLDEDLTVSEVAVDSRPVLHHVVFSRTSSPDPDGFFECDVLFQNNWLPVFISGTGDASLKMPDGAGHVLPKGTQLTVQLHLLNATLEDITDVIPVGLRRSTADGVIPVSTSVFGTVNIALPPKETVSVQSGCKAKGTVHLFSAFAHMHYLGRSMVVSVGPDEGHLTEVFRSDPYDFNYQALVPLDLTIHEGDHVRVACEYENFLDRFVTFGESSTNEMCFFIAFGTGAGGGLGGCIGGGNGNLLPEACGTDPPNDIGVGAHCTKSGGECQGGLVCTEDYDQIAGSEVCIGFGCQSSADCGSDGVCCQVTAMGANISLCVPPSCIFTGCNVAP